MLHSPTIIYNRTVKERKGTGFLRSTRRESSCPPNVAKVSTALVIRRTLLRVANVSKLTRVVVGPNDRREFLPLQQFVLVTAEPVPCGFRAILLFASAATATPDVLTGPHRIATFRAGDNHDKRRLHKVPMSYTFTKQSPKLPQVNSGRKYPEDEVVVSGNKDKGRKITVDVSQSLLGYRTHSACMGRLGVYIWCNSFAEDGQVECVVSNPHHVSTIASSTGDSRLGWSPLIVLF